MADKDRTDWSTELSEAAGRVGRAIKEAIAQSGLPEKLAARAHEEPRTVPSFSHIYLSTACWHAQHDGDPELHAGCRNSCKFCNGPCGCPCHGEAGTQPGTGTWVDQARGVAVDLLAVLAAQGVDLAGASPGLHRRLRDDPGLFWARGEAVPPGEWREDR